jgi:hypothetical protein
MRAAGRATQGCFTREDGRGRDPVPRPCSSGPIAAETRPRDRGLPRRGYIAPDPYPGSQVLTIPLSLPERDE